MQSPADFDLSDVEPGDGSADFDPFWLLRCEPSYDGMSDDDCYWIVDKPAVDPVS
jgi:hypothetical protein